MLTRQSASVGDDQSASIRVAAVARIWTWQRGERVLLATDVEDHLDLRSATAGPADRAAISQAIDQRKAETASRVTRWFETFPVVYDDDFKLVSEIADAYLNDAVVPGVVRVLHRVGDGLAHAQLHIAHPLVRKSAIPGDLRDDFSKRPNKFRSSFCSDLQRGDHGTSYVPYARFSQRRNMQLEKSSLTRRYCVGDTAGTAIGVTWRVLLAGRLAGVGQQTSMLRSDCAITVRLRGFTVARNTAYVATFELNDLHCTMLTRRLTIRGV